MKSITKFLLVIMLSLTTFSACATKTIYISKQPPVKIVEVKPVKSHPNMVWIEGHWKWHRRAHKYVWVPGKWQKVKKNRIWISGGWEKTRRGWIWVQGYWK